MHNETGGVSLLWPGGGSAFSAEINHKAASCESDCEKTENKAKAKRGAAKAGKTLLRYSENKERA